MNQVSRPMQIMLVACLVFAGLWFTVLKPKPASVAATPVTPTPAATVSTAKIPDATANQSAIGRTIQSAKNAGAADSAAVKKRETLTGDASDNASSSTSSSTGAATSSATATKSTAVTASTPAGASTTQSSAAAAASAARKKALAASSTATEKGKISSNPAQRRADKVILQVKGWLADRDAVVVLVYSKRGTEDRLLHHRIANEINLRHGRVKHVLIPVSEVGRYDGLLSGLSLAQTPSTIVIAPNNEAKVLGGLTSVARIDRLTSSAIQIKPVATK